MANAHDVAYDLEKAIKESEQFVNLKEAYEALNNDEPAKKMFDNFRNMNMELQQKQAQGQEVTEEEVQKLQQQAQVIQQNETIGKLMETEQAMNTFVNDLNKIIMTPLEELYKDL